MQDRYAGDIGDYVKLGLLRALSPGRRLGVAWYRYPDEGHNKDGRHIGYLSQPARFAGLDPELYELLATVIRDARTIRSLHGTLPGATWADEVIKPDPNHPSLRRAARHAWFARVRDQLSGCNLIFADPDNGLVDDSDIRKGSAKFGKQMPLQEARDLAAGRCAVIYHHNTRRPGGHDVEVEHWLEQIAVPALAVRAPAYSPRTFFVINPDVEIADRAARFCERWQSLSVRMHRAALPSNLSFSN